jgi:hypothetical protein
LEYFKYYFTNIHPFIPVLSQHDFYQQWAHDRDSISPLLLEAIFACVTAMLNDTAEFSKWIALAARKFNPHWQLKTLILTQVFRGRGEFQRCSSPGYGAGTAYSDEGSRIPTKPKGLLLPIVDGLGQHNCNGKRSGPERAFG